MKTLDLIKENIRSEISALIFKTLAGLVLACVAVFSLVQLGQAFQVLFSRYEYGLFFEILTFTAVSALCAGFLYYLFKDGVKAVAARKEAEKAAEERDEDFSPEGLLATFTDGLRKGLEAGHEKAAAAKKSAPNTPSADVTQTSEKDETGDPGYRPKILHS